MTSPLGFYSCKDRYLKHCLRAFFDSPVILGSHKYCCKWFEPRSFSSSYSEIVWLLSPTRDRLNGISVTKEPTAALEKANERALRIVFNEKATPDYQLLNKIGLSSLENQRRAKIVCTVFLMSLIMIKHP